MKDHAISLDSQRALTKLLIKLQLVNEEHLKSLSAGDSCPLSFFARQSLFDEEEAIQKVAKNLGISRVIVDKNSVAGFLTTLDDKALAKVKPERWRELRAFPAEVNNKGVLIAFANPLDHNNVKALEFDLGLPVRIAIAKEDEILEILARKLNSRHVFDLASLANSEHQPAAAAREGGLELLNTQESNVFGGDVSAPPVIRLVNKIFSDAVQMNASDIHVNPEKEDLQIKVRVDGIMRPMFAVPAPFKHAVISRMKLLAGMDIAEKRKPQDGRLRIKTGSGTKDLRLSTVPTVHGENIVIRVLTSELSRVSFDSLGCDDHHRQLFEEALKGNARVVLVTGPTGSGKSSTLYACLLHARDGTNNIITIEDPIEYRIQGINQIQVNNKIGMTFASGLRSMLRQDPDIIMVGEIRDAETADIVMQAAQTGHLVLSTLHTNTAAGAITRLKDLGVPEFVVSAALGSVVAQRLIRKLCDKCSEPASPEQVPQSAANLGLESDHIRVPVGCDECGQSGYAGRTALYSFLDINDAVREAIRRNAPEHEIEDLARPNGFKSLQEMAIELINNGTTSIEEVERCLGSLTTAFSTAPVFAQNGAQQQGPSSTRGLTKRRILLIEDDENTRAVLNLLLSKEMFEVIEAQDGLEALECVYQTPPELIVCDVMMPRMNGLEFLKKLRLDPRTRPIPVLMLTAADTENNELRSLQDGANDFVSKTSDSKIMLARVHRLLNSVA